MKAIDLPAPQDHGVASRINKISTAVPGHDFDRDYQAWVRRRLVPDPRRARLYERMASRSGIEHRWTVLDPDDVNIETGSGFYGSDVSPSTRARMAVYEREAPQLALSAIEGLSMDRCDLGRVTHLVLASCTGFMAPGVDQVIARRLGLAHDVERVLIGFMGCYAATTALRTARHIVRSQPDACVMVVTVEISTMHLPEQADLELLLAGAQFADGAAAAIVTGEGEGLVIGEGITTTIEDSADLITWRIGDFGFLMTLSGEVPGRITRALSDEAVRKAILGREEVEDIEAWAVHAGGRSILDAVESGFRLPQGSLTESRAVLRDFGNMSSSTLMFVLASIFKQRPAKGIAMAFGPGLAVEGFRFGWRDAG